MTSNSVSIAEKEKSMLSRSFTGTLGMKKNMQAVIYLMGLLFVFGCAPKLFEVNIDKNIMNQEMKKISDSKFSGLAEVLKKKQRFELAETEDKPGIKRFVRKDLQDFIDREWNKGWEYIKTYPIEIYASGVNSGDGLLAKRENLAAFEFKDQAFPKREEKPAVKFSFVHLSDVQLRDERVYMFGEKLTEFGDLLANGFQHEPDLIAYDYSYYLAQIGIIKRLKDLLPPDERPRFVVHTGDALHMGVVSELYEFIYITNKLNIPWFNAFGNHDYQVFGNLNAKDVGVIKPNMGFQTVNSRYNFINMHGKGFNVDRQVYFSPDTAPDNDTRRLRRSVYNGFDMSGSKFLEEGGILDREDKPCSKCPGYYHFEAKPPAGSDPGILIIVLDTTTQDFRFAEGTVYRHNEFEPPDDSRKDEQIKWLQGVLEEYANKGSWMVLAFGHHALNSSSFFDGSWKKITSLFNDPKYNVVAYFCGHSHEHVIYPPKNENYPGSFGFWQIKTDSIMEYPKRGSLVYINRIDNDSWEIAVRSFWPYFLEKLPADAPILLKNANRCFEASKRDKEGIKKEDRFRNLHHKNYDVLLRFPFPKTK